MDSRHEKARDLRQHGLSIKQIAKQVGAAQSSISIWVKDVRISAEQQHILKRNTHTQEVIDKRRLSRIAGERLKREKTIHDSQLEIKNLTKQDLHLLGVALYWAEGGKTQSAFKFSNGDPRMIELMIKFLVEICAIRTERIKIHIHIHEHLDVSAAEKYWLDVTRLPKSQFYKTYNKPNKSSKNLRNSLPYGVCDLYVTKSSNLLLRTLGWINGIYIQTQQW
jgi:predicted transcriptional regulator